MIKKIKNIFKGRLIIASTVVTVLFSSFSYAVIQAIDFTENNPRFCISCHLMQRAYSAWEASVHKEVNCHDCHSASIFEKNLMLFKTATKNKFLISKKHDKTLVPRVVCKKCHWDGDDNSIKINESYGHARHAFMLKIECTDCHVLSLHTFKPSQGVCIPCHEGKGVHWEGMKDFVCLRCHNFNSKSMLFEAERCVSCHDVDEDEALYPMQFDCRKCHKPHLEEKEISMKGRCVTECHTTLPNSGKHSLHTDRLQIKCTKCHFPHEWKLQPEDEQSACFDCHNDHPENLVEEFLEKQ